MRSTRTKLLPPSVPAPPSRPAAVASNDSKISPSPASTSRKSASPAWFSPSTLSAPLTPSSNAASSSTLSSKTANSSSELLSVKSNCSGKVMLCPAGSVRSSPSTLTVINPSDETSNTSPSYTVIPTVAITCSPVSPRTIEVSPFTSSMITSAILPSQSINFTLYKKA